MAPMSLGEMLHSVADRGREILARRRDEREVRSMSNLCRDLMSERGEASGVALAREFSQRVRVIACLESRPFMLHSDLRDYGLDSAHWRKLRRRLRANLQEDTVVVVWGPEEDAATSVHVSSSARARP